MRNSAIIGVALCVSILASCETLSQNVRVVPDHAKACVARAEEEKMTCRERLFSQYQQCKYDKMMVNNQKQMYQQRSISDAKARFDRCMERCMRENKTESWMCGSSSAYCGGLKDEIESMKWKSDVEGFRDSNDSSCEAIYRICEDRFESQFRQCGGYWEKR
jgi:hypothetical protein